MSAQLYPQALGSIFVTSYNLRSYGRGIQTHRHTGNLQLVTDRARVTLWLAVYCHQFILAQSPLRIMTRDFFPLVNPCSHNPYVTSSLMRGWVCLVWIGLAFSSIHITHIACYWKFSVLHCIEIPCQSRLWKADHAYLTYFMLQRQLSHLNGGKLDCHQVISWDFMYPHFRIDALEDSRLRI
jgi:hypothetical protein